MHKDFAQYAKALREEPFTQGEYQTLLAAARSKLVDAKRRNLALDSLSTLPTRALLASRSLLYGALACDQTINAGLSFKRSRPRCFYPRAKPASLLRHMNLEIGPCTMEKTK
jgi:hypothetical protein